MSYSLSLQARLDTLQTQEESEVILLIFQDFVSSHHPRVPYSSRTAYTNQFIKSYDDYEQELRNVYQGSFFKKNIKVNGIFHEGVGGGKDDIYHQGFYIL